MAFLIAGTAIILIGLVVYALLFTGRRGRNFPDGMHDRLSYLSQAEGYIQVHQRCQLLAICTNFRNKRFISSKERANHI